MKNYLLSGRSLSLPAPRAILSGNVLTVGILAGVAKYDAAQGEPVEVETEGVFQLLKTSGEAWAVGDALYVIPATGILTKAKTAGTLFVGAAVEPAASAATIGVAYIKGGISPAVTA